MVVTSLLKDFTSKIIPTADAFVGCMVAAVFIGFHHIHQKLCKVIGVGRRANLVVHNREMVSGLAKIQHGLNEVFAVYAKYPCDANDVVLLQKCFHSKLAFVHLMDCVRRPAARNGCLRHRKRSRWKYKSF